MQFVNARKEVSLKYKHGKLCFHCKLAASLLGSLSFQNNLVLRDNDFITIP